MDLLCKIKQFQAKDMKILALFYQTVIQQGFLQLDDIEDQVSMTLT